MILIDIYLSKETGTSGQSTHEKKPQIISHYASMNKYYNDTH